VQVTDEHTLEILGYFDLLKRISRHAASSPGGDEVMSMRPLASLAEIVLQKTLISEIRHLDDTDRSLALEGFARLDPLFSRLRPRDGLLKPAELLSFVPVLSSAESVTSALAEAEDVDNLKALSRDITARKSLRQSLQRSIGSDGEILDTASPELKEIRRKMRTLENRLQRKLQEFIQRPQVRKYIQEDFVTRRAGRWVIPVRRDSMQLEGLVHDVSNTGETVFLEPIEMLPMGNEIGRLSAMERAEEARVVRELCASCREHLPELELTYRTLVKLDALIALAGYAARFRMTEPHVETGTPLIIRQGRHPLLREVLMEAAEKRETVPLDIEMGAEDRKAIVVTGPNTGGKTVALKTVGLLCLMALSGMHVPAEEGSIFPYLEKVAADIGDEQSIEHSLSTFSGHMTRISELLAAAGPGTLLLMDELGSGTDPDEGGPLAAAILEEAVARKALVMASTHLGSVKGFVHEAPNMMNAAVLFDHKSLKPTYRLQTGVPGQSHALYIAGRYGIPDRVIKAAQNLMTTGGRDIESLIADLNRLRDKAEQDADSANSSRRRAEQTEAELKEEMQRLKSRRKQVLLDAATEAAGVVRNARAEMDALLKQARASLNDLNQGGETTETLRKAAAEMSKKAERLRDRQERLRESSFNPLKPERLKEGETYFVKSLEMDAVLLDRNRKTGRCRVRAGALEVEVGPGELGEAMAEPSSRTNTEIRFHGADESVPSELNLIGQRVDPALDALDRFLDQAVLSGHREVRVIHGMGTGALARAVRDFIASHPHCLDSRPARPSEGGDGATIVRLNTG